MRLIGTVLCMFVCSVFSIGQKPEWKLELNQFKLNKLPTWQEAKAVVGKFGDAEAKFMPPQSKWGPDDLSYFVKKDMKGAFPIPGGDIVTNPILELALTHPGVKYVPGMTNVNGGVIEFTHQLAGKGILGDTGAVLQMWEVNSGVNLNRASSIQLFLGPDFDKTWPIYTNVHMGFRMILNAKDQSKPPAANEVKDLAATPGEEGFYWLFESRFLDGVQIDCVSFTAQVKPATVPGENTLARTRTHLRITARGENPVNVELIVKQPENTSWFFGPAWEMVSSSEVIQSPLNGRQGFVEVKYPQSWDLPNLSPLGGSRNGRWGRIPPIIQWGKEGERPTAIPLKIGGTVPMAAQELGSMLAVDKGSLVLRLPRAKNPNLVLFPTQPEFGHLAPQLGILRSAVEHLLPPTIPINPKRGFAPLSDWVEPKEEGGKK